MRKGMSLILLSVIAAPTGFGQTPSTLKPPPIEKGAGIALVVPAGPVSDAAIQQTITALERAGYTPIPLIPTAPRRGYLSADDNARLSTFNMALNDPRVDAILCMRGGYGTPRILDGIDYEAIRKNPKPIIGYSDITALLLAIRRQTGLVVFHGPMGKELGLRSSGFTDFTAKHFWGIFQENNPRFARWGHLGKPCRTVIGGVAEGVLTGGNLSLVAATMGTPYEIDTRDAILFIEDVSEKPFRIDRMLAQLRLAGKLGEVRGILLGSFQNCVASEASLTLDEVFLDYFRDLGVPVLGGYPAGHGLADHAVLPLGIRVRLDADKGTLSLLESPVQRK